MAQSSPKISLTEEKLADTMKTKEAIPLISYENGVFSLNGEGFSYIFRVSKHGQLELLHFGAPAIAADADAFACKTGTGWGCSQFRTANRFAVA